LSVGFASATGAALVEGAAARISLFRNAVPPANRITTAPLMAAIVLRDSIVDILFKTCALCGHCRPLYGNDVTIPLNGVLSTRGAQRVSTAALVAHVAVSPSECLTGYQSAFNARVSINALVVIPNKQAVTSSC